MKKWMFLILLAPAMSWAAADTEMEADFDSLGGNTILLERARAINPEVQNTIVQSRTVSRRNRLEIAPEYGGTFGGDTYSRSQSMALNLHYHLNPRWSLGAKFGVSANRLTPEGQQMVDRAYEDYLRNPKNPEFPLPELDYPKSEMLAIVNWYPVYGKLNLLEKSVAQFDTYLLAGAGTVTLKSGTTPTGTLGGGIGFWLTPKVSTRLEMRYQRYQAQYLNGPEDLDLAVASVQVGWFL